MFEIYQWSEPKIIIFILVFIRCFSFLIAYPIFSAPQIPTHVKVLLPLLLAFTVFPTIWLNNSLEITFHDAILWLAFKEVFLGLFFGSIVKMLFFSLNIAGQVISASMGLSAAQFFNPYLGSQSTVLEQFEFMMGSLFFLVINGHHILLTGMVESFHLIPLSFDSMTFESVKSAALMGQTILTLGIKMSAPVMVAILLTQVGMGIIGRVVPQINVLVTSLHLTILIGIFVIFISAPYFLNQVSGLKDFVADSLIRMMKEF